MKFTQPPMLIIRLMIAGGLLMATLPNLFAEHIKFPDFLRGTLIGLGIGLEFGGFILLRRLRRTGTPC